MLQKQPVNKYRDLNSFGSIMPGREYTTQSAAGYRFGFNGMEENIETYGEGNCYSTLYRQYDARIGKWLSLDPIFLPYESPYVALGNNPNFYNDILGNKINPKDLKEKDNKTSETLKTEWETQTGLTLEQDKDGNWDYKKDAKGKPIVSIDDNGKKTGSKTARKLLIKTINSSTTLNLKSNRDGGTFYNSVKNADGSYDINIDQSEVEEVQREAKNMDPISVGYGMIVFHEVYHWVTKKSDYDNGNETGEYPGLVVTKCNKIQKELGYPMRTAYTIRLGDYLYAPYDQKARTALLKGKVPPTDSKYFRLYDPSHPSKMK